eukprot:TRINITY_DN122425_c0_g1_i1.p1 TRINITY_DN122425_c0_g1~~TRINITY_DN122425_c0_g1_i1.p1  ORF type:complete len:1140 (+),score=119.66 TRINITY_DN122425_c0_g1_i1:139-3420(+)
MKGEKNHLDEEAKQFLSLRTSKYKGMPGIPDNPKESVQFHYQPCKKAYIISKKWYNDWKKYMGLPVSVILDNVSNVAKIDSSRYKGKSWPGPINNLDILDDLRKYYTSSDDNEIMNTPLKPDLKEGVDYKIINEKQWNLLYSIYGGKAIKRPKYKPEFYAYFKAEVYLFQINLSILPQREKVGDVPVVLPKPFLCSKAWTIGTVKEKIVATLNSSKHRFNKVRLWKLDPTLQFDKFVDLFNLNKGRIKNGYTTGGEKLEENCGIEFPGTSLDLFEAKSLKKCDLGTTDIVVLEQANEKGEFIFRFWKDVKLGKCEFCCQEKPLIIVCKCDEAFYCSEACMRKDERFHIEKCPAAEPEDLVPSSQTQISNMGLTGLQNVGNTCFLNAGIQCLSNTWELTKYFLEGRYKKEVNVKNKLGLQGKMAQVYAQLLRLLWYDNTPFVAPWEIKKVVGRHNRSFVGHTQQDCHEFINAILDGLNEDLNRVTEKPYIPQKSTDNPDDDGAIALESWYNHLIRNQSIIVDLMHGLFKSTLKCPNCGRFSCTFDPYSAVMLPVVGQLKVRIVFYYVPFDVSKPLTKCSVDMDKDMTVENLREIIASMFGVEKYSTILAMMSGGTFDKFLCASRKVKKIHKMQDKQHSFLHAMEIDPAIYNSPENVGIDAIKKQRNQPIKSKDHDDYNNGLSEDILRISVSINQFVERPYWKRLSKECKANNRFIYVKRGQTLKDLHFAVLRLLKPLFPVSQGQNEIENMKELFPGLTQTNYATKLSPPHMYPYTVRFINPAGRSYYRRERCAYCGQDDCENCIVPYTDKITVADVIKRISPSKDPYSIKNDYYYHDHDPASDNKKDLEIEVVFNQDPDKVLLDFSKMDLPVTHKDFREPARNDTEEVSIYDCLVGFSHWETLDPTNLWYCNKCKNEVQASKRIEIVTAPPILILQLKRFRAKEAGLLGTGARVNCHVDFPLEDLDLTSYVKESKGNILKYDLYAVSNHYGTMGFGHYITFAKSHHSKDWYKFDDTTVTKLELEEICTPSAYILFYKRKDLVESEVDYEKIKQTVPEEYRAKVLKEITMDGVKSKKEEVENNGTASSTSSNGIN